MTESPPKSNRKRRREAYEQQQKRLAKKSKGGEGKKPKPNKKKAKALPSPSSVSLPPPRKPLPPHQLVLAPMVGGSELAFRLLARRHGAQLCYTPMIKSEEFNKKGGGVALLERHVDDAPLVAHFSGNDAATLLTVAKRAERCPGIVAIDLNLGCPQRSAHSGHFGAFLCEPHDRPLLLSIVATCAKGLGIPFFCKIRLLDDLNETLEFASQLEAAGCALLCVHARYRGSPMHRRDGPAHLDQVKLIKERLNIPVLANGNVRNASELLENLNTTGADGIMSAEGALDDPTIFRRAMEEGHNERKALKAQVKEAGELKKVKKDGSKVLTEEERQLVKGRKAAKERLAALPKFEELAPLSIDKDNAAAASTSKADGGFALANDYIELVTQYPPPGGKDAQITHTIYHVRRMLRDKLNEFELMDPLKACTSVTAIKELIQRCKSYSDGSLYFEPGWEAARRLKEADATRKAVNAARRQEFVDRMVAKAKKEGQPDEYYLQSGKEPPGPADITMAKGMKNEAKRAKWWRANFGQHCLGHHVDDKCPHKDDPRGCGFLHGEE